MQINFTQHFCFLLLSLFKIRFSKIGLFTLAAILVTSVSAVALNNAVNLPKVRKGASLHNISGTAVKSSQVATQAAFAADNPDPILESLSQYCITQGFTGDLKVRLYGAGFVPGAKVRITYLGLVPIPYDFTPDSVSSNGRIIYSTVPASYVQIFNAFPGPYNIQIINPEPADQDGISNTLVFTIYPAPNTGAITGNTSVCAGASNVVYSVPAITGATYNWQLPTNATLVSGANTNSITVNFNNATSGTIAVTATSGCGTVGTTSTLNVSVTPGPTVSISASALTFCNGSSVLLTAKASGNGLSYQWQNGTTDIPGANEPTYRANASGTYSVRVSSTSNTCSATSNSLTVRRLTTPVATIIPLGPLTICEGVNVALAAPAAPAGDTYTYQWYNNNQLIPGATNQILLATGGGSYTVVVINGGLCTSAQSAPTVVNIIPAPVAPVVPEVARCGPGILTLAISNPQANMTYRWYNDPAATQYIATGITYAPALTQSSTYYVTAVNSQGCESLDRTTVEARVRPLPEARILPEPAQCLNTRGQNTFLLDGEAVNGTLLRWEIIEGSNIANITAGSNTLRPTVSVRNIGTVRVRLTVVSDVNCGSDDEIISLVVSPVPTWAPIALSVVRCGPGSVTLTASGAPTPNDTYNWYNAFGIKVASGTTFSPDITQTSGTVLYYVSAANNAGCENTSRTAVTVTITPPQVNAIANINIIENSDLNAFTRTVFEAVPVAIGATYTYRWLVGYGDNPPQPVPESSARLTLSPDSVPINVPITVQAVQIAPVGSCVDRVESPLSLALNLTPLPVEMLYFNAKKKENNVVELEWATAMEKMNSGFQIEVSQDAKNYRNLAFVPTKNGNTTAKQVYAFHDKENGKYGTRYYRIKQMDADGKSEYFGPKAVQMDELVDQIVAYPNPFSSQVNLDINAEAAGNMHVLVTNAVGAKVLERTLTVQKGSNKAQLQLNANLPLGMYIVTTRLNGKTTHIKLLKQ